MQAMKACDDTDNTRILSNAETAGTYMQFESLKDCMDQSWIEENLSIDPIARVDGTCIIYDYNTDAKLDTMFVHNIRDANGFSSEA